MEPPQPPLGRRLYRRRRLRTRNAAAAAAAWAQAKLAVRRLGFVGADSRLDFYSFLGPYINSCGGWGSSVHGWGVVGVSSQGSWRVSSQGSWGRERVSAKQGRPCSGPFEWPGIRDGSVAPALQQEPAGQAEAANPARGRSGPGRRLRVCTTQLPVTSRLKVLQR